MEFHATLNHINNRRALAHTHTQTHTLVLLFWICGFWEIITNNITAYVILSWNSSTVSCLTIPPCQVC